MFSGRKIVVFVRNSAARFERYGSVHAAALQCVGVEVGLVLPTLAAITPKLDAELQIVP